MRQIVLDMQSGLYAKALRRSLVQELEDCNVVISGTPQDTASECRIVKPYALLMEVTGFSPWMLPERLAIRARLRELAPDCKVIMLVNEQADPELAEQVKKAKQEGQIDAFLYTSTTEGYLAAVMDSL